MKRIIKFPLIMGNEKEVRTIDELRENFNLERLTEYYLDGKLKIWLQHRNYTEELSELEKLEHCNNKQQIPLELCKIFDVEKSVDLNVLEIEKRKNRISILKSFCDDEIWVEKLEFIVFNQEELDKKLLCENLSTIYNDKTSQNRRIVYLCGEMFRVSDKFKDIIYVGVNKPTVNLVSSLSFDAKTNNIIFENVKITSNNQINLKIKEYKSCIIDTDKVKLKNIYDFKYCKTFREYSSLSIAVDDVGNVHILGITANGENYIPKFDAPIIDVAVTTAWVVAVDKNGKVYQWGSLPYKCSPVPDNLPKIKQVTLGYHIAIVLDEYGKLHFWGGFDIDNIFSGEEEYGKVVYKKMPDITSKIVQVMCKGDVVMALDENGKVYSWGYYSGENSVHNIPKDLPFIKKIALFYRGEFAFALDEYGKLHFWGKDEYGNSNIPENLPFIIDISEMDSIAFSALDENGRIHVWGECSDRYYDSIKKMPNLRYLVGFGGISEDGYMYDENGILFNSLKAMLPIK